MPAISYGYNGPLYQENWARLAAQMGARYVVDPNSGANPLGVTAIAGSRRVSVGAGTCLAAGVLVVQPAEVIDLPVPTAGSARIYLLVMRRTWGETPSSELALVFHSYHANVTPRTDRPTLFPADMRTEPGVVDDQPLAWVWVNGDNNTLQTWDVRTYPPLSAPLPTAATKAPLGRSQEYEYAGIHTAYVGYVGVSVIVNVPTRVFVDFQGYWYSDSTTDTQGVSHRLVHASKGTIGGVSRYTVNNGENRPAPGAMIHIAASGFLTLEPGSHYIRAEAYRVFPDVSAFIFNRELLVWEV